MQTIKTNTPATKPVVVTAQGAASNTAQVGGNAAPARPGKRYAPASRVNAATSLTVLATGNPKRGKSASRFALYFTGNGGKACTTKAHYIDAVVKAGGSAGLAKADLAWDLQRGFIKLA